jgi:hypothetical protein
VEVVTRVAELVVATRSKLGHEIRGALSGQAD